MSAATAPFPAFDRDPTFRDLLKLMKSERPPLALIGAGASIGSGYPAWPQLLENLRESALRGGDKRDWRRSLEDLSDAPWVAEVFASHFPQGGLARRIRRYYSSRHSLAEPHLTLAELPFRHFLTTNYDPSIEEALKAAGRPRRAIVWPDESNASRRNRADAEALSDFLINLSRAQAECTVLYLHGRYDSHEDRIILTESDYVARYIRNDDARRKLMAIFMTHPVVFIGFSMNDPDLANLMREVTARLRTKTPCHYALMGYKGEADREAIRARMIGKFGVRPVFYSRIPIDPWGDEYSNLLHLLNALRGEPGVAWIARPTAPPPAPTPAAFDPDDPVKGRFGGRSSHNGRSLSAVSTGGSEEKGYLTLEFVVAPEPKEEPVAGDVVFHLHPTFRRDVVQVPAKNGRATLSRWAWGAFTIGAEADGGATRLELDLAKESHLPKWFRRR